MIAYVTPLSKHGSIVSVEGEPDSGKFGGFKTRDGRLIGKRRWYGTRAEAVKHMIELRDRRITLLKKEIARLERLSYENPNSGATAIAAAEPVSSPGYAGRDAELAAGYRSGDGQDGIPGQNRAAVEGSGSLRRRGGAALRAFRHHCSAGSWLLALALAGCAGSNPVTVATPPVPCPTEPQVLTPPPGSVDVNGLITCKSVQGVLTNCALNSGATLDDFVNSTLWGIGLDAD